MDGMRSRAISPPCTAPMAAPAATATSTPRTGDVRPVCDGEHAAERVGADDRQVELAGDHRDPDREGQQAELGEALQRVVDVERSQRPAAQQRRARERDQHEQQRDRRHRDGRAGPATGGSSPAPGGAQVHGDDDGEHEESLHEDLDAGGVIRAAAARRR